MGHQEGHHLGGEGAGSQEDHGVIGDEPGGGFGDAALDAARRAGGRQLAQHRAAMDALQAPRAFQLRQITADGDGVYLQAGGEIADPHAA